MREAEKKVLEAALVDELAELTHEVELFSSRYAEAHELWRVEDSGRGECR